MKPLHLFACVSTFLAAATAWAGITTTYSPFPPIVAGVEQSHRYVLPGGQVTLRVSDGRGGVPYDRDTEYIDGSMVGLVDDTIASVYWSVPYGSGSVSSTYNFTTTWTVPSTPGTYSLTLYVNDGAIYGSGSDDTAAARIATVTVTPFLPARHFSARPTSSSAILLEWYAPSSGTTPGGYNIYHREEGSTTSTLVHQRIHSGPGPYIWTDTGRAEGKTYYYKSKVVDGNGGERTDLESPEIIATPREIQPTAVAYVANSFANNVLALDTITNTVYATIAVGPTFADPGSIGPLGVTVTPDGARAYVSNFNEDTASTIEASTHREVDRDNHSGTTYPTTAVPGINRLLVRTPSQPQPKLRPDGVAVKVDTQGVDHLFVASFGGRADSSGDIRGTVNRVKTSDGTVEDLSSQYTFGHPRKAVLSPDGNDLYITDSGFTADDNAVVVFNVQDPAAPTFSGVVSLPTQNGIAPRPQGLTFASTPNGVYAYVVNTNTRSVSIIDTAATPKAVVATTPLERDPALSSHLAYPVEASASPDGRFVFVVGTQARQVGSDWYYDSLVWMVDTTTNTVVDTKAGTPEREPFAPRDASGNVLYGGGRIAVTQTYSEPVQYIVYISNFKDEKNILVPAAAKGNNVAALAVNATGSVQSQVVIPTGEHSGPGGIALRTLTPLRPYHFNVYATGSGKLTLYWRGIPGATGYNIYRSQTPGLGSKTLVASNVNSRNMTGGDMHMHSDTGLNNGTEYFYIVKAQFATGESAPSEEDSDVPAFGAVPWDTRDVGSILSAFRSAFPYEDWAGVDFRVVGPDGWIYESGFAEAQPPDGRVVNGGTQVILNDGTVLTVPRGFGQDIYASSGIGTEQVTLDPHNGPYRRVRTLQQYQGVRGELHLPSAGLININAANPNSTPPTYTDIAHIYLGMSHHFDPQYVPTRSGNIEVDAGLQWSPVTGSWSPFMNINRRYVRSPISDEERRQRLEEREFITALVNLPQNQPRFETGGMVFATYYSYGSYGGVAGRLSLLYLDGSLYGTDEDRRVLGGPTPFRQGFRNSRMKRAHSIAQPTTGVQRTGSSIIGVNWRQGQLLAPNGSWGPWGSGVTDEDGEYEGGSNSSINWSPTSPYVAESDIRIVIQPPGG